MLGPPLKNLELLELLGLGGAAEVYRALDLAQQREVAVKILTQRAEPDLVARFIREGQVLSRLHHPHIVEVYRTGEEEGQRYLVMELVRGGSLRERLQRGPLPWREAVEVAIQIAQALEHAHAHQVIHRDLKPGNILFDDQGRAKLTDFGLAHLEDASAMTRTGTVMGTVLYLSPEQAVGRHVDARSDLYALGAVLFEMLTGQPPFTGPSAVSIIYKHLNEQPPQVRRFNAEVPPMVEAVVERLLQKDPARRFANATETIAALQQALLAGEGEQATTPAWEPAPAAKTAGEAAASWVGREDALQTLREALEAALAGMGRTVLIAGEAGLGKTRLAHEFAREARGRNVLTLSGACLYEDAPHPYAPFVEMLHSYEERVGAPQEGELAALWRDARALLGLGGAGTSAERAALLQQASPTDAQAGVFELWTLLLQTLARQRPLLLVVDDLQFASPTTLQLFHYLARNIRRERILLLGLYRPEELLPGMAGGPHPLRETLRRMGREQLYQEIPLRPLTEAEVGQIAAEALNVLALDPEFTALLQREVEGNPFYLLEILRLLQEQGALERVGDHWELVEALEEVRLPEGVVDVLMRRIERVSEEERNLLEWGAVLGHRLDVELLAAVLEESRLKLIRRLYALEQQHGLIASDEQGFYFAHGKVREVLYAELPPSLRREYHLSAGQALEERWAANPQAVVYDLARHFAAAQALDKGYRYALLAAERAEATFAPAEAAGYLEQALDLLGKMPATAERKEQRLALEHRLGRLLATIGRQEDACAALERALCLSRELGRPAVQAEILLDLGVAQGSVGAWAEALRLAEESLRLAEELGATDLQARTLLNLGFLSFEQGHWDQAVARLERALAVAREHGHELLEARALGNLAIVHNARGERREAIALYQQSIATFSRHEQLLDVARGFSNVGFSHYGLGEYEEARRYYGQALELATKVGDVREQGIVHLHLAEVMLALGDLTAAREHCVQASRRFARLGFELGIADVDRVYAGIACRESRWAVAERYLMEAIAIYQEHGDQLNLAEAHEELGKLLAQMGQQQKAQEELERSRTLFNILLKPEGMDEPTGTRP